MVRGYHALPYAWDNHLQIRDTPDFLPSLNGILAWIADGLGSWCDGGWAPTCSPQWQTGTTPRSSSSWLTHLQSVQDR